MAVSELEFARSARAEVRLRVKALRYCREQQHGQQRTAYDWQRGGCIVAAADLVRGRGRCEWLPASDAAGPRE
jgi:hypothetical protein